MPKEAAGDKGGCFWGVSSRGKENMAQGADNFHNTFLNFELLLNYAYDNLIKIK